MYHGKVLIFCIYAVYYIIVGPPTQPMYDGQIYLCPHDNFPTGRCSVSTGLVQLHLYDQLRGINQKVNVSPRLDSYVADSICRQLGYTNAVLIGAVTLKATKQSYSHCYGDR